MVVLSGSMSGEAEDHIEVGDLVFVGRADPEELEVGDVIAYMNGGATVTHRITAIDTNTDGDLLFTTKGDANNAEDTTPENRRTAELEAELERLRGMNEEKEQREELPS